MMKHNILSAVLLLAITFGGIAVINAKQPINFLKTMISQTKPIPTKELYDAFKKDQTTAIKQYGGVKTVRGFVVYTGPDVYALPSVELSETENGKSRLLCVLPFSDYLKLRKVKKGDEVTITGEVRGFYEKGDQVLLKNCVIK